MPCDPTEKGMNERATSTYRGGSVCPACKSTATSSRGECLECGAVWGEAFLCPFCAKHTRPVPDALVRSKCSSCKEPRLGPNLDRSAYRELLAKRTTYRRWHARALLYVPAGCAILTVVLTGLTAFLRANALVARRTSIAETMVDTSGGHIGHFLPPPEVAFVLSLMVFGAVGAVSYVAVALSLRGRVAREAARLSAL